MRGKALNFAIIGCLVIAVSCSFSLPRRNLRTVGVVSGIALDEEDGAISATFELYDPSTDLPIGRECTVLKSKGDTLEECISNVVYVSGKELYCDEALVLILGENTPFLVDKTIEYFSKFKHDHMNLAVIYADGQQAGDLFADGGKVLSISLLQSVKKIKGYQTIRDLMNGGGRTVRVQGKGQYAIIT